MSRILPERSRFDVVAHLKGNVLLALVWLALLFLVGCSGGPPPIAPSDVFATAGPGTISLTWNDNSANESSFAVLRAQGDVEPVVVATLAADSDAYVDDGVAGDAPYVYWVEAVSSGGRSRSAPSNSVRPGAAGKPIVDPNDPVGVSLNELGIDTTATPRIGDDGNPLPDDYLPLGPVVTLGLEEGGAARYELFIGGAATSRGGDSSNQVIWEATPGAIDPLYGMGAPVFDLADLDANLYTVAAADVDGDGLEELVMASLSDGGDGELTLSVLDDAAAAFTRTDHYAGNWPDAVDIVMAAGDFDGDGVDTVVIALGGPGAAELLFFKRVGAGFDEHSDALSLTASVTGAVTSLALASGNLDDDPRDELAIVINESFQQGGKQSGVARYAVLDDADQDFAALANGFVQGQDGAVHNALVADVGTGDIDGDGRGEVVFGGITTFHDVCASYDLLYLALDDARPGNDLKPLGAKLRTVTMGSTCQADNVKKLRFIHVELGDVDGDQVDEIVGGPMVFDDWSAPWSELGFVPANQMYGHGSTDGAATNVRINSALALVDMDGDGAAEIVYYMPRAEAVIRYTLPSSPGGQLRETTWWIVDTTEGSNGNRFRPLLAALNVDQDSLVAKAVPNTYRFTMTEPIIIAALAGPPCFDDLSQNVDACGTSFGQGTSTGEDSEWKVTSTASVSIGFKATGGALTQSELTVKGSFHAEASTVFGHSYELEKTVSYTTGPLEDAVVFTAIPYDQFTYQIVQHNDPTMIGKELAVNLPRTPITLLVERSYFNQAQAPGALQVDDGVFQHTIGDPTSYRSVAQRDELVDHIGSVHMREALMNGPVHVGQGGGSTEVSIDLSESSSTGNELEVGYEIDVEVVGATILGGFNVGESTTDSFSWSHGTSTHYTGGVGNFADGSDFAAHSYGYGMFVYVHEDPESGEQFEVIDYWVE